jgi:alkylated DNA repair dioxygenase AlkB
MREFSAMDLFASSDGLRPLPLPDGELWYMEELPLPWPADEVFARLRDETAWQAESIMLYGQRHQQPRLTAWHGDKHYTYSGLTLAPLPWTRLLARIRAAVELATGRRFNSVLLNYYRDGRDSMGMHADDEPELGPEPAIASLTFGEVRPFTLRHRKTRETRKLLLGHGSLLLMAGKTQQNWLHGIAKSVRPLGPRINLTFRYIR